MSSGNANDVCGFVDGECLYRISISVDAWHRLVSLSMEGVEGIPYWIDFGNAPALGRRTIATVNPGYFDTKQETHNAKTGRDQAGFTQL